MQTSRPKRVASVLDMAIDTAAMGDDIVKYERSRDESLLKFKPGMQPTWFYVRPVPTSLFESYILTSSDDATQFRRCFEVGVERVENLHGMDGTIHQVVQPTQETRVGARVISQFSSDDMDLFAPAYKQEIGSVVWGRSFLPPGNEAGYPRLPMLLAALIARMRHDAEETPEDYERALGGEKPAQAPSESAPPSAPATDATAKAPPPA